MAKFYYGIAAAAVLGSVLLAHIYFGTVFNESVRHPLDIPAMLFVAPGLLLNHFMGLGLPFDGPHQSEIIWLSGLVYAAVSMGTIAIVRRVRRGGAAVKLGKPGRNTL